MEFFESFPFTKLQGKNRGLDWVIQKIVAFQKEIDKIPEYVQEVAESGDIKVDVATDKTLTQPDTAADAEAVGERFTDVDSDVAHLSNSVDQRFTALRNYVDQSFAAKDIVLSTIYPVGAIYASVNSTSPANLFGGTWEQLKDRFLLGAGDTYSAGKTGGEATHTLTTNEMPAHSHKTAQTTATENGLSYDAYTVQSDHLSTAEAKSKYYPNYTAKEGGGKAHNNMPPYLVVYMWKRVA